MKFERSEIQGSVPLPASRLLSGAAKNQVEGPIWGLLLLNIAIKVVSTVQQGHNDSITPSIYLLMILKVTNSPILSGFSRGRPPPGFAEMPVQATRRVGTDPWISFQMAPSSRR